MYNNQNDNFYYHGQSQHPYYNFETDNYARSTISSTFDETKCKFLTAFLIFLFAILINIIGFSLEKQVITLPYTIFILSCSFIPAMTYLFFFMCRSEKGLISNEDQEVDGCLSTSITLGYVFFWISVLAFAFLTFFIIYLFYDYATVSRDGFLAGLSLGIGVFLVPVWVIGAISLALYWCFLGHLGELKGRLGRTVGQYNGGYY